VIEIIKQGDRELSRGTQNVAVDRRGDFVVALETLDKPRASFVLRTGTLSVFLVARTVRDPVEIHRDAIRRLLKRLELPESDLFLSETELIEAACDKQEQQIAYPLGGSSALGQGEHN
jgi:hypothetical protein